MMRDHLADLKKSFANKDYIILVTAVPQIVFFISQLLILRNLGLEYSGQLAYVGAISTILSVIVCQRWDVEILINTKAKSENLLTAGIISIFFYTSVFLLLLVFLSLFYQFSFFKMILLASFSISLNELTSSYFFKNKNFNLYLFVKTFPAFLILLFSEANYLPSEIWAFSFLCSALFSVIVINFYGLTRVNLNVIRRMFYSACFSKTYPTITALSLTIFISIWVILVKHGFGDIEAGIWANTIRIFNSAIGFLILAIIPFMLSRVGDIKEKRKKILIYFKLWFFLIPCILLTILVIMKMGGSIYEQYFHTNVLLSNYFLCLISLIGIIQMFIYHSQGIFQSLGASKSLLLNIFFSLLIILMGAFLLNFTSFNQIIYYSFAIVLFTAFIMSYTLYKTLSEN
jgi:hypothetical protein